MSSMVETADKDKLPVPSSESLHDDRSLQNPERISKRALDLMGLSSFSDFSDPHALGRIVEEKTAVEEIDGIPHFVEIPDEEISTTAIIDM